MTAWPKRWMCKFINTSTASAYIHQHCRQSTLEKKKKGARKKTKHVNQTENEKQNIEKWYVIFMVGVVWDDENETGQIKYNNAIRLNFYYILFIVWHSQHCLTMYHGWWPDAWCQQTNNFVSCILHKSTNYL